MTAAIIGWNRVQNWSDPTLGARGTIWPIMLDERLPLGYLGMHIRDDGSTAWAVVLRDHAPGGALYAGCQDAGAARQILETHLADSGTSLLW